ncbi:MAG TPA: sigma-70 family RNA polymerase sigma factor [Streptosporangiaceae bacterium]
MPLPVSQSLGSQDPGGRPADGSAVAEFEQVYRTQVDAVTAFFARRSTEPQTVADLTADTFVRVITSLGAFDPDKGSVRAWVFGIARRVYAAHCEAISQQRDKVVRLAGRRELDPDQIGELEDRIDAERAGRKLVTELTSLPDQDRLAVELVDMAGLSAKEAAIVLGASAGATRMRLMRTRARLRKAAAGPAPAPEEEVR